MRKFLANSLVLALILITLVSCGKADASVSMKDSATASTATTTPDATYVASTEGTQDQELETITYAAPASHPSLTGISNNRETWEVIIKVNYIPITPDGYTGPTADYSVDYTDQNGNTSKKTYHDVAFFASSPSKDYEYDTSIMACATVNGKETSGFFIFNQEELTFLQCSLLDGKTTLYPLNIDIPMNTFYVSIIAQDKQSVLMKADSYLFVYRLQTKSCELITKDALDYKSPVKDKLYFVDWSHDEFVCDWSQDSKAIPTNSKVIAYHDDNFDLIVFKDFEHDFFVMQNAFEAGTAGETTFSNMYDVYSFGNIYSSIDGQYLSNIHLPKPYRYNRNRIYAQGMGAWQNDPGKVTYYRYGNEVFNFALPDGNWVTVTSYMPLRKDPNSNWGDLLVDTNNDGLVSAQELKDSVTDLQVLLYNATDHTMHVMNASGNLTKVADDVQDYCEAYGELYWMDSKYNAYELSWYEDTDNILIGKDVVGISKHTDERAGFVVKPGDLRCNMICGGTSLCTLYGDDWLNQKDSSGAWALGKNWE